LNVEVTSFDTVVECNVGKLFRGSRNRIEVLLKNLTGVDIEAKKISASCGCIGGLVDKLSIDAGEVGRIISIFQSPKTSGPFEKTISILTPLGKEVRLQIVGESISRVEYSAASILISELVDTKNQIFEATSVTGDDLSKWKWNAECDIPVSVSCQAKEKADAFCFEVSFDLGGVSRTATSTILKLSGTSEDGKTIVSDEFMVYYTFNASVSPHRLILKRKDDVFTGVLVVKKADYSMEGPIDFERELQLRFGNEFRESIPVVAKGKRLGNGTCLLKFKVNVDDLREINDQQAMRLVLDLNIPDFFVEVYR
jgi:hypothetical protein